MTRFVITLLRLGLWCLGVVLFTGGLIGLTMGHEFHSDAGDTDPVMLQAADVGMMAYGLVLMLHWRLLASALLLGSLLVGATVSLLGVVFFETATDEELFGRLLRLLLGLGPLALALVFVAWDRRNLASRVRMTSF